MQSEKSITRKKVLKIIGLGSISTYLAPALFTTSCAASRQSGGYQSYDEIYNAMYPFSLADLPYDYDALEPAIDAKTMEIHHGRHHQRYINYQNRRGDYVNAFWDLIHWENVQEFYKNLR